MTRRVVEYYDAHLYTPVVDEYYDGSDYGNFGYWEPDTKTAAQASFNLVERLLSFIPVKSGMVLDVACGKGGTTRHLLRYYDPANVLAINISAKQVKSAKGNAPGSVVCVADAAVLPFADESFDALLCVEAAFHFFTRERFFGEALRVLKPGGRLVLADVLMTREAESRMKSHHEENYLADPESYRSLARIVGFANADIVDVTDQCWGGHFWNMVHFNHARFLENRIGFESLKSSMDVTYRFVKDLKFYLLACLRKGGRPL